MLILLYRKKSKYRISTCVSQVATALVVVDKLHTVEAARSVAGPRQAFI